MLDIFKFIKHLQDQRSSRDTFKIKSVLLQFSKLESEVRETMEFTLECTPIQSGPSKIFFLCVFSFVWVLNHYFNNLSIFLSHNFKLVNKLKSSTLSEPFELFQFPVL